MKINLTSDPTCLPPFVSSIAFLRPSFRPSTTQDDPARPSYADPGGIGSSAGNCWIALFWVCLDKKWRVVQPNCFTFLIDQ